MKRKHSYVMTPGDAFHCEHCLRLVLHTDASLHASVCTPAVAAASEGESGRTMAARVKSSGLGGAVAGIASALPFSMASDMPFSVAPLKAEASEKESCDMCDKPLPYHQRDLDKPLFCGTCQAVIAKQRKAFEDASWDEILEEDESDGA